MLQVAARDIPNTAIYGYSSDYCQPSSIQQHPYRSWRRLGSFNFIFRRRNNKIKPTFNQPLYESHHCSFVFGYKNSGYTFWFKEETTRFQHRSCNRREVRRTDHLRVVNYYFILPSVNGIRAIGRFQPVRLNREFESITALKISFIEDLSRGKG